MRVLVLINSYVVKDSAIFYHVIMGRALLTVNQMDMQEDTTNLVGLINRIDCNLWTQFVCLFWSLNSGLVIGTTLAVCAILNFYYFDIFPRKRVMMLEMEAIAFLQLHVLL